MASEQTAEDDTPLVEFSSVWVKMEVEEEPLDMEQDEDHLETEDSYQEACESGREPEENSQESQEVPVAPRRSRRKAAAPRKARNVEEKIFQCEYCDYKALHKSSLKYHTMKHTKPEPLHCEICTYTTNHAASLRRHMLAVHTDKDDPIIQAMPDIKCKDCDFTCKFSWKLFVHRRKHVDKSFQCDQCDFATARKSNFEKHCKTHKHRDGFTYECDKCPFVTKHEGHISRHLAVIHKEVSIDASKCDFCEFSTKVRWRLNIHKKNSRQERPIKCEFCDFVTDYNCEYKLHKHQHIADMALLTSGIEFPKDQQGAVIPAFKPPKGMATHMTENSTLVTPTTNEKEFIVDTACEEIDWRSIEVGEKAGQEKPFHCIVCPYKSKFKASVQRHYQRNHTSENSKPYKCVNCEFSTKTRDQISLHSKRSKSGYVITCKVCDFATFYKCQMAEHQKVHWRYKCKLCDYICRVSYDLNQHYTVVHLGQGLKCRFCDFQAARKGSLLNHENTHTNKRFRCGLCDYSATRRNLLFNHIKRCHAGEKPKIIISDRKFDLLKKVDRPSENVESVENILKNVECDLKDASDVKDVKSDLKGVESDLKGDASDLKVDNRNDEKGDDVKDCKKAVENEEVSRSNEINNQLENVDRRNKFETQVCIERETEYGSENLQFQSSNMFGNGSMRNGQGIYEVGSRQNVFYSL